MSDVHRCNFQGCRAPDAEPKFTKLLSLASGKRGDRQPVWRCERHWNEESEVGAISGRPIKRRFGHTMGVLGMRERR